MAEADVIRMKDRKPRDENDRLRDGTLPKNPGDDATVIAIDSPARRTAAKLAYGDAKPTDHPHDLNAEVALIAALIWNGTYASSTHTTKTVADLVEKSDWFFTAAHQHIWSALVELQKREAPADATAVHSELVRAKSDQVSGGMQYLEELVASAQPASELNLREYAESIREAHARRHLMAQAKELYTEAKSKKGIASDIAARAAVRLNETASTGVRDAAYVHISTPLAMTVRKAQQPMTQSVLTTGIPRLNELLLGGLRRRQVTVLAARTSVGKSALALDIGMAAHEANPEAAVLYISLEMSEEEFTDRLVSSRASVDLGHILQGSATPAEVDRIVEATRILRTKDIYFNVKQNLSTTQIRGIATKLARSLVRKGRRLGLIITDHGGLVKPSERKASREQEVADVSRGCLDIANELDCHHMVLVQINRKAEEQPGKEKMPQMHHLRDSGAWEQDANTVLLLHRQRDAQGDFVKEKAATLRVAKARNGKTGPVWLAFEPEFARFTPWETSKQGLARAPAPNSRQYAAKQPMDDGIPVAPPGRFEEEDEDTGANTLLGDP